jgi:hypothetical protein
MKSQADKHRRERVFAVGDRVFLRLQPYIQSSVARRSNRKLAFKFFGPFSVLARVGEVAYRLDLPPSSRRPPRLPRLATQAVCWPRYSSLAASSSC